MLNALEYSSSVNIDITKIKLPTESQFSSHEEKGIEGLVELGRAVVATNVLKPPEKTKLPLVSNTTPNSKLTNILYLICQYQGRLKNLLGGSAIMNLVQQFLLDLQLLQNI